MIPIETKNQLEDLINRIDAIPLQFSIDPSLPFALEYVRVVDEKYEEARANKWGRFSEEWTIWSRQINKLLAEKQRGELRLDHLILLSHASQYWYIVSQLVEMYCLHRHPKEKPLNVATKERFRLKALIHKKIKEIAE